MNIVEKYKEGVTLDTDRQYDLYITRNGYHAYREMISLNSDINALNITLEKQGIIEPDMIAIAGGRSPWAAALGIASVKHTKSHHVNHDQSLLHCNDRSDVEQFEIFVSATGYVTDAEKNAGGNAGCFTGWKRVVSAALRQAGHGMKFHLAKTRGSDRHRNIRDLCELERRQTLCSLDGQRDRARVCFASEAEWELAARANTSSPYGQASSARGLCAIANVADRTEARSGAKWSSRVECTDGVWFTAPVASYQPNAFGLFDMQGNTWEWVADTWADDLSTTPLDGSANTQGINSGRVLRGGGWDSDATRARLSSRSRGGANGRATMTGFRLVLR